MSAAGPPPCAAEDPVLDPGLLAGRATLEFNGWQAALATGGAAVLPWRTHWLAARTAGIRAFPDPQEAPSGWDQVLVRLGKGRTAGEADLAAGWERLAPDGRLLLAGSNALGITSAVRRLGRLLGVPGQVLTNRAHARVVAFPRSPLALPRPPTLLVPLAPGDSRSLELAPGVFSGRGLDAGTAFLLTALPELPAPGRILDLGCGAGHLAINALLRWPGSRAELVDSDARACGSANLNLARLDLTGRARVRWLDAGEALDTEADLALVNPPCHEGVVASPSAGGRLLLAACACLAQGGRLLAVANRRLPYEEVLASRGRLRVLRQADGYKLLELERG